MKYTIRKFFRNNSEKIRLICGEEGLDREISSAGILDYEFIPFVKGRYEHNNFEDGQLVMTSFLYAKDNPHLITEAVRQLIQKGCSGLIIKNIFRLEIPNTARRLADAQDFPVFLLNDRDYFYEDFIREVYDAKELCDSKEKQEKLISRILHTNNREETIELVRMLFPDLSHNFRCYWIDQVYEIDNSYAISLPYQKGCLLLESCHQGRKPQDMCAAVHGNLEDCHIGISQEHFYLGECKDAIEEAVFACRISHAEDSYFEKLGIYRLLLKIDGLKAVSKYAEDNLENIRIYDYETNSNLMETLDQYIQCDGSLSQTAEQMKTHINTIRYRLEKISELSGLNYKKIEQLEELILSIRIIKMGEYL